MVTGKSTAETEGAIKDDAWFDMPWAIWPGEAQTDLRDALGRDYKRCALLSTCRVDASVVTFVFGSHEIERLIEVDAMFATVTARWVPIYVDDGNLYFGPILRAGKLCISCLYRRRLAASRDPSSLSTRFSREEGGSIYKEKELLIRLSQLRTMMQLHLDEYQLKIHRNGREATRHPILRVPGCPMCCRETDQDRR